MRLPLIYCRVCSSSFANSTREDCSLLSYSSSSSPSAIHSRHKISTELLLMFFFFYIFPLPTSQDTLFHGFFAILFSSCTCTRLFLLARFFDVYFLVFFSPTAIIFCCLILMKHGLRLRHEIIDFLLSLLIEKLSKNILVQSRVSVHSLTY